MRKQYFEVCPKCGAHLDPGEKCDCEEVEYTKCSHCGEPTPAQSVCLCQNRARWCEKLFEEAKGMDIPEPLEPTIEAIKKAMQTTNSSLDIAILFYTAGIKAQKVYEEVTK